MSLRPRYSLLTLLIFTALVAGGVKLWYGPHRVSIGEMPTVFEQAILEKGQALGFTTDEWQYEYDYIQSWQERQILSVTCFPTTMYYMIAMGTPDYRPGRKYLFSEANYHKYLNEDSLAVSSKDQVHCWIQLGREPADRVNLTGTMPSPLPLPGRFFASG